MHNIVKLVQANGKGLVIAADAITIVRTLEPKERENNPNGRSGVWLMLGGMAQHAVVRESFGFILRKAGGDAAQRVQLAGLGGTRISLPRALFGHAIESERVEKEGGNEVSREDATIIQTTLHSGGGPVAFHAKDSAEAVFDLIATEASEDDDVDDEEEGN